MLLGAWPGGDVIRRRRPPGPGAMEGNREEAERCVGIALAAARAGQPERARRFLLKAQRLYPTPRARGEGGATGKRGAAGGGGGGSGEACAGTAHAPCPGGAGSAGKASPGTESGGGGGAVILAEFR